MTTYTIKGLYVGCRRLGEEREVTYFGTLKDCMRYVDNNSHRFTHYGEDVKICVGDTVVAIQRWVKGIDEAGEYWEAQDWERVGK